MRVCPGTSTIVSMLTGLCGGIDSSTRRLRNSGSRHDKSAGRKVGLFITHAVLYWDPLQHMHRRWDELVSGSIP